MDISHSILTIFLYSLCLSVIVYGYWTRWHNNNPGRKFTYSISEIWAAIVGLTPTMIAVKNAPAENAVEVVGLLLLSQLAGILMIKFSAETNPDGLPGWVHVLMGAIVGLALILAVPVALCVLCLVAIATVVSVPITVPLILATRLARRKRTAEPWQVPGRKQ